MNLPRITNYGSYSSSNYGAHTLALEFGDAIFYFSYKTLIAFHKNGQLVVHKNDWGNTTGRHLNYVDNGKKSDRLTHEEFCAKFKEMFKSEELPTL